MKYISCAKLFFQAKFHQLLQLKQTTTQVIILPAQSTFVSPPEENVEMSGLPLGPLYQAEFPLLFAIREWYAAGYTKC